MASNDGLRVVLLARVSDEKQRGNLSVEAQLREMRARCVREGWRVVHELVAIDESAYTAELARRPSMRQAVEMAEAGLYDLLMVHESSRFARKVSLHLEVEARLERAGVRWVECHEPLLERTPESFVMGVQKAAFNEYWSQKMSQHIRKGYAELFAMGLPVGDVPFGYRRPLGRDDRGVETRQTKVPPVVVEAEAEAIREGFRMYVGGAGYAEIARAWNELGLRPRSKVGNVVFTGSAVQSVLENDFYCGFVRYKGERRVGAHVPIIDEDLWLAAQAKVARRPARARHPRLLCGLATCVTCGATIQLSRSGYMNRTAYYRESAKGCRPSVRWRVEEAEAQLEGAMLGMALDERWLADVDRDARQVPVEDGGVEKERAKLQAEKRRATTAYVAGALDEAEWKALCVGIDGRLLRLPAPMPGGVVFAGARLAELGQVWAGMTVEERRDACRALLEGVEVDTEARRLWVRPWGEVDALFRHRREWCSRRQGRLITPERTRSGIANPVPWLYESVELVVAS